MLNNKNESKIQVIIFKMYCNICKREILDGMIYYKHPDHGYVCECCPQFDHGGFTVIEKE